MREPDEFTGPLGHIKGAALIPLGELADRAGELKREVPIVAVCRAGGRSAQATVILQQAGFKDVANLTGGMLRWRAEGHPVEGGSAWLLVSTSACEGKVGVKHRDLDYQALSAGNSACYLKARV